MSSSIFSSKGEAAVIGAVLAVLLSCELVVRFFSERLSIDISHIQEIPKVVQLLQHSGPQRLLFLGNSLTRAGVDKEIVSREIQGVVDGHLVVESIYPDDTTICDWYYIYQTYLAKRKVAPETVVVGFVLKQLEDGAPLHMGRLGGYFAGWSGMSEAFEKDVLDVGDRIYFGLSTVSSLFANQERIRERVLDLVVPYYRSSAQTFNKTLRQLAENQEQKTLPSYNRLRRFIRLVQTDGTKLIFVAMPLPGVYPVSPDLQNVVQQEGAMLIDMRSAAALPSDVFPDRYHLSDKGAKLYSAALAVTLRNREIFAKPGPSHGRPNNNQVPTRTVD